MAYIGKSPSSGIRNRFTYTATAGQTTFSGSDDHNKTLTYTDAEFADVFLNGIKLDKSDYTATSGTSIVLDEAAAVDDIVEVIAFDTFSVFSGDFSQDVTVGGNLTASADATITGDLTVDTDTLYVDSTNNKVGVGTSSPNTAYSGPAIHIHSPSTNGAMLHLTDTTTGATNTDGMSIFQYSTDGYIHMRENGSLRTYINGSERMRIDSSGNVLVGTTNVNFNTGLSGVRLNADGSIVARSSNSNYFLKEGTGTLQQFRYFSSGTATSGATVGSIAISASTTAYNTTSDYRLKENVTGITDGIVRVKQLTPSRFNFIVDPNNTVDGFIAHEAATVVPEAVTGEKDAMRDEEYEVTPAVLDDDGNVVTEAVMGTRSVPDHQGIDQSKLVPLLTAALQEAITKIETLETKVAALEAANV